MSQHSQQRSAASLIPAVYSGACCMAIRITQESDTGAALRLASALQAMGAELLRIDASNRVDLHVGINDAMSVTHIVYNKSYSADEMAQSLGGAANEVAAAFSAGLDLQALFDLGPKLWTLCDHDACLGRSGGASKDGALTLQLFVEMAQLSADTLRRYTQFVDGAKPAAAAPAVVSRWHCVSCTFQNEGGQRCEMCNTDRPAATASAAPPTLPPPPAQPPAIPSPPVNQTASTSVAPTPAASAAASGPTFTVASWNILSADYSHPSTFFYCEPADLSFSSREPRILSSLAEATTVPAVAPRAGSDIECLQEVDFDAVSRGMFDADGVHGSVFVRRPNQKRDGCLIRWRDDVFELMPLPQLVAWQPHHPTKQQLAQQQIKRDTTHVRVHCPSNPQANMDRLGERKQKEKKSTAASSSSSPPVSASNGALNNNNSASPSSSSDEAADTAAALLAVRQSLILDRTAALSARVDALRARFAALKASGSHSHSGSSSSLFPPSLGLARSISQERAEGAPKVKTQLRRDPSIETVHPGQPHYFHALHFNDLSLLTRSKHNCHSSLFARYKKENVGVLVLLRHRTSGRLVLTLNLHAFWNPEFSDVKIGQCMLALQTMQEMKTQVERMYPTGTATAEKTAAIICGDFNSTPDSDVYRLLTQGEVPLPAINAATQLPLSSPSDPVPIVSSPQHEIVFAGSEEIVDAQKGSASAMAAAASSSSAWSASSDVLGVGASSSPNVRIKLLLDSTLLRITKWLRAIGVDTVCMSSNAVSQPNGTSWTPAPSADPSAEADPVESFFALARAEGRRVVTQNKSLLRRRGMPGGAYAVPPNSKDPLIIFQELCEHFGFRWDAQAFYSRCTTCNQFVYPLTHEQYSSLPFLPAAYAIGVDDDGDPLRITRCIGPSCGRVRWWSSSRQLRTRQKLFQVRLDLDVSDLDDDDPDDAVAQVNAALAGASMPSSATVAAAVGIERPSKASAKAKGWQIAGMENVDELTKQAIDQMMREETKERAAAKSAAKAAKQAGNKSAPSAASSSSSSSVSAAAPAVAGPPAVLPSESEIAAARAARKASKAQNKTARAQQAADRKSLNKSKVHFEKTVAEAVLHGEDGEYLFDKKPTSAAATDREGNAAAALPSMMEDLTARTEQRLHSQQRAIHAATLAAAATVGGVGATSSDSAMTISRINGPQPPASKSIPRELYGQVADSMDQAVQELWWTAEKKAHMISVERRIAAETRRVLRARREQKRVEAEQMMTSGGEGKNKNNNEEDAAETTADHEQMDDALPVGIPSAAAASTAAAAAPPNPFAARLHSYWQSVTDRHVKRQSALAAPKVHAHSLGLESAYTAASGSEPACTNVTPRFLDCIDYIMGSAATLCVEAIRPQPTKAELLRDDVVGYPSAHWPSDHCLLQATYRFR